MYDDPRDATVASPNEVLTEDSDDALADLEKEFAVKKQKLMEERARKRERVQVAVEVERSPSPKRERKPMGVFGNSGAAPGNSTSAAASVEASKTTHAGYFPKVEASLFSSRLYDTKANEPKKIDYSARFFEFENIPPLKTISVDEHTQKDPVSGEILNRRYLKEDDVEKLLRDVKVLRATKLLAKITAPRFEEPDYVNWCFSGIVMSKSDPKTTVNNKKYMLLRVGNFMNTVDLMLFGDAFQRYWKLRKGDVVVALNPTVKKFGQGFNLSLSDDLDSILEIGTSRNFGHCTAKNVQGERCKNVVDTSKNELCSFHEESKYKQGSRMELQGSVKSKAPTNKQGQTSQAFMARNTNQSSFVNYNINGVLEKGVVYDGGLQFDEGKYDRPIKENHVMKLRKQRANEKLRKQLVNTAAPNRLEDLERLGIVPQAGTDEISERHSSLHKVRQSAFKGKFLTSLGYDPTHEMFTPTERAKPTESMNELLNLSRHKKISLKPSKDDKCKKAERWKQNISLLKKEKVAHAPQLKAPKRETPSIELSDDDSHSARDDDSDIEIAFTCAAQEQQYKAVVKDPGEDASRSAIVANGASVSGAQRGEPHSMR